MTLALVQTCRGREELLAATLASLEAGGWPTPAVVVVRDNEGPFPDAERTAVSIRRTFGRILIMAELLAKADRFLLLEDDLNFLPDFTRRVNAITDPIASLYDPEKDWGAQAFVMSRPVLEQISRCWWGEVWPVQKDWRLRAICAHLGHAIPRYPLVQHEGRVSSWGGPPHQSATFLRELAAAQEARP